MSRKQSRAELDEWYGKTDPWEYRTTPDDAKRRMMILAAIPDGVDSIIDLGCGEGFITEKLVAERVVGVDVSRKPLKRCTFKGETYRIDMFSDDITILGQFDLVLVTGVLYGSTDEDIARIVRLLNPGKYLLSCHITGWSYNVEALNKTLELISEKTFPYRQYKERLGLYREKPTQGGGNGD